jgi:hypothetical protein
MLPKNIVVIQRRGTGGGGGLHVEGGVGNENFMRRDMLRDFNKTNYLGNTGKNGRIVLAN